MRVVDNLLFCVCGTCISHLSGSEKAFGYHASCRHMAIWLHQHDAHERFMTSSLRHRRLPSFPLLLNRGPLLRLCRYVDLRKTDFVSPEPYWRDGFSILSIYCTVLVPKDVSSALQLPQQQTTDCASRRVTIQMHLGMPGACVKTCSPKRVWYWHAARAHFKQKGAESDNARVHMHLRLGSHTHALRASTIE